MRERTAPAALLSRRRQRSAMCVGEALGTGRLPPNNAASALHVGFAVRVAASAFHFGLAVRGTGVKEFAEDRGSEAAAGEAEAEHDCVGLA